jgi:hypothetical protein
LERSDAESLALEARATNYPTEVQPVNETDEQVFGAGDDFLREIMREVIRALPDEKTLGEIIDAAQSNAQLAPVLNVFMVQDLIELALERPPTTPADAKSRAPSGDVDPGVSFDEDGNPVMALGDAGPAVIRRRADVPDGDLRVLKALAKQKTGRRETDLLKVTGLTAEQLRLLLRGLRTKAYVHVEGSGTKLRYKLTRHGSSYLRRQPRAR